MSLSDTTPAAQDVQIDLLRAAGPARRAELALGLSSSVIRASRLALRRQNPDLEEAEVLLLWAELHYGKAVADAVRDRVRGGA